MICGELASRPVIPTRSKPGLPPEPTVGSGQLCTPLWRMHWLKFTMPISKCGIPAGRNWSSIPAGGRWWQPVSAALSWELPTLSCCALGNFALVAPVGGSGKSGTPSERTQREKASNWEDVDSPALVEPRGPLDDEPPHAAASRAKATVAA